jgi:hypothetical protein
MENPSRRLKPRDNRSSDAVMYEATCIPLDDVFLSAIKGNKDRCMPGTPTTYVVKKWFPTIAMIGTGKRRT